MLPDSDGRFGKFGGKFVPETVMTPLQELEDEYVAAREDAAFRDELAYYLSQYAGRPTPLYFARRLSRRCGRKVYLKREDLCHTGAHKINNTLGQLLLAVRMGKSRVIAETGAGQHGVATATVATIFGLECDVYMGEEDIERQALNVFRMRLLGARVIPVRSGSCTLKDAINEAMRDWVTNIRTTNYVIGSVMGPHPYPVMVRDFQSIIGRETKAQILEQEERLPDCCVACVGGGSNAIGMFHQFFEERQVRLIGVEAAGLGIASGKHSATLGEGSVGVLHGSKSYLLQDENGMVRQAHSISAGLDYPGVGPEHSYYKSIGRAEYVSVTDAEALEAFRILAEDEGILPALECAHAVAHLLKIAPELPPESVVVICLSGRGDKDVQVVADAMGVKL